MTANSFIRSFRSLGDIFRPPFDGLWLAVTLYFFWTFLIYPHSPIVRGDFPDTDDYMYLNQILDWMGGQGWYDNVQHRLDPPNGVPIHFSRLAMLPMAAIIYLFEFFGYGLGPKGSATLMAVLYPVILLGGFFLIVRWTAESFMMKEWAGATAFVGFFATHTIYQFSPGHIDHHNLITTLVALGLGLACRMIQNPDRRRWPLYLGLVMAIGLTIALEILPWLLLYSVFLGIWAAVKGGNAARSSLLYGLTLFLGSAVCLALTRLPSDLSNLDVLTYSAVYVIMMAGVAVCFAGVYVAAKAPVVVRFLVGGLLAVVTGGLFFQQFPAMVAGPYGGIDPALSKIILDEIVEAQPMKSGDLSWMDITCIMGSSFLAVPLGLYYLLTEKGMRRWLWGILMTMLTAGLALTLCYQRRFAGTMNMFEIIPFAVLLQRGWGWIGLRWRGRKQFFAELGLIVLAGPLLVIFLPALYDGRSLNLGVFLFPVVFGQEGIACESYELENALRDPTGLGRKPLLIMNSIGEGPEILFRTNHKILAAPFHMDVEGNLDSTRFFSTPYPEEAEAIVRRRHIDLVVSCQFAENFYFHIDPRHKNQAEEGPGKDFAPHFIERLLVGHIPPWLKPVKIPGLRNYVIYEVLPPGQELKEIGAPESKP